MSTAYNGFVKRFTPAIILLVILLLIVLPYLVTGYREEAQAKQALEQKQYQRASRLFNSAAKKLLWRTDLYEQAGIASYLDNDYSLAVQQFERAHITSAQGWDYFGLAYYLNNQPQQAVDMWQTGAQNFPNYPLYYRRLSLHYHNEKNYDLELQALTSYLALKQDDASAQYDMGIILLLDSPDEARTHLQLASSLDGEFEPASRSLITALEVSAQESDEASAMIVLGRALGLVDEWDLARSAFERAIHVDEENAEAWAWLGEANQQTGQSGSVELERALALDARSAVVRSLRGLYWKRLGKDQQALNEYLLAAQYEPENPAWLAAAAEMYVQTGDLVQALTFYQRATELAPNETTYWRLLADFCASNNLFVEDVGLPAAQKAVELAPDDALALHALGWNYYVTGRLTLAEQTLNQAIKLAPNLYIAYIHLGLTHLSQSNFTAAYNDLTFVRDADKDGEAGKIAQDLLKQYFP